MREEMGVPTDPETQVHVDFVQEALKRGSVTNINLKPNPGVQIKLGYKLSVILPAFFIIHHRFMY